MTLRSSIFEADDFLHCKVFILSSALEAFKTQLCTNVSKNEPMFELCWLQTYGADMFLFLIWWLYKSFQLHWGVTTMLIVLTFIPGPGYWASFRCVFKTTTNTTFFCALLSPWRNAADETLDQKASPSIPKCCFENLIFSARTLSNFSTPNKEMANFHFSLVFLWVSLTP